MEIKLVDFKMNSKTLGDTKTIPIPRIGELVFRGYVPAAKVTCVTYFLNEDKTGNESFVAVYIDGWL